MFDKRLTNRLLQAREDLEDLNRLRRLRRDLESLVKTCDIDDLRPALEALLYGVDKK